MHRLVALTLALLVSGCTAPEPRVDDEDPAAPPTSETPPDTFRTWRWESPPTSDAIVVRVGFAADEVMECQTRVEAVGHSDTRAVAAVLVAHQLTWQSSAGVVDEHVINTLGRGTEAVTVQAGGIDTRPAPAVTEDTASILSRWTLPIHAAWVTVAVAHPVVGGPTPSIVIEIQCQRDARWLGAASASALARLGTDTGQPTAGVQAAAVGAVVAGEWTIDVPEGDAAWLFCKARDATGELTFTDEEGEARWSFLDRGHEWHRPAGSGPVTVTGHVVLGAMFGAIAVLPWGIVHCVWVALDDDPGLLVAGTGVRP